MPPASGSATTNGGSSTTSASEREGRLVSVLSRARGSTRISVTEGWLFAIGGALVLVGLVLILIDWIGSSQTILVAGQIPYLISGGLLGLGLIFLGGFLYFGHWLAVLVRESRDGTTALEQVNRSLVAIADLLERSVLSSDGARARTSDAAPLETRRRPLTVRASLPPRTGQSALLATPSGTMAHRPDCPVVANRDDVRTASLEAGFLPCRICAPDLAGEAENPL
jgi:hypothetical protein